MDGFGDFAFEGDLGSVGPFADASTALQTPTFTAPSFVPAANDFGFNLSGSFDPSTLATPSVSGAGQFGGGLFGQPVDLTAGATTPSPASAAGGSAGAGGGSWLGDVGSTIKNLAGPVGTFLGGAAGLAQIPLSLKALDIARQGQQAQQSGIQTAQQAANTAKSAVPISQEVAKTGTQVTAPALQAEQALLPAGTKALMGGPLPDVLQANIDQQVNEARQQMLNNLLRSGMSAETANSMIAGQLEQLRMQLTLQASQALFGAGEGTAQTAVAGGQLTSTGGQGTVSAAQAEALAGGLGGQLGSSEFQLSTNALTNAQQALQRLLGQSA